MSARRGSAAWCGHRARISCAWVEVRLKSTRGLAKVRGRWRPSKARRPWRRTNTVPAKRLAATRRASGRVAHLPVVEGQQHPGAAGEVGILGHMGELAGVAHVEAAGGGQGLKGVGALGERAPVDQVAVIGAKRPGQGRERRVQELRRHRDPRGLRRHQEPHHVGRQPHPAGAPGPEGVEPVVPEGELQPRQGPGHRVVEHPRVVGEVEAVEERLQGQHRHRHAHPLLGAAVLVGEQGVEAAGEAQHRRPRRGEHRALHRARARRRASGPGTA